MFIWPLHLKPMFIMENLIFRTLHVILSLPHQRRDTDTTHRLLNLPFQPLHNKRMRCNTVWIHIEMEAIQNLPIKSAPCKTVWDDYYPSIPVPRSEEHTSELQSQS